MESSRTQRLQALKDRWLTESVGVQFPSLGVEISEPTTPSQFVASHRILAAEEATNLEHFGIADPKAVLASLTAQFEAAPQVDPKVLKDAATVLEVFKADSERLVAHFAPDTKHHDATLHASYAADINAAAKCQELVASLAAELGISLLTKAEKERG